MSIKDRIQCLLTPDQAREDERIALRRAAVRQGNQNVLLYSSGQITLEEFKQRSKSVDPLLLINLPRIASQLGKYR